MAIFPNVCLWCRSLCLKKTSQVLTLKNCIEPLSYASTAYVVTSYGPRFCSTVLYKFGQLTRIFWANGLPPSPPRQKIARTPMFLYHVFVGRESLDVRYCFLSKAWRDRRRLTSYHLDLSVCCFWSWNTLQHYPCRRFCEIYWEYRTAGHLVFWKPWPAVELKKVLSVTKHSFVFWA